MLLSTERTDINRTSLSRLRTMAIVRFIVTFLGLPGKPGSFFVRAREEASAGGASRHPRMGVDCRSIWVLFVAQYGCRLPVNMSVEWHSRVGIKRYPYMELNSIHIWVLTALRVSHAKPSGDNGILIKKVSHISYAGDAKCRPRAHPHPCPESQPDKNTDSQDYPLT